MWPYLRRVVAKLKDKFTTKVPTFVYSPAVCPKCGAQIEVPLSRNPMSINCHLCKIEVHTMAIGILDTRKDRLKYVFDEVTYWVRANSEEYNDMKHKEERMGRLH